MQNKNVKRFPGLVLASGLAVLLSACGSLPDMEDAKTVRLQTYYYGPWVPKVDVDGNPELRPGAMARAGLQTSVEACSVLFMFCALYTVPIYTVTGAAITAADTLPEEQAEMLNRLSAKAVVNLNMPNAFEQAITSSAIDQGLDLQPFGADYTVRVSATELWWEVSVGNQVSLRLTVEMHARHGDKEGRRRLGYRGEPAHVKEWLAGGEQHIREALDAFLPEASEAIWLRVLDRDQ